MRTRKVTDVNGENFSPFTHEKSVFDSNGVRLDAKLISMAAKQVNVGDLSESVKELIEAGGSKNIQNFPDDEDLSTRIVNGFNTIGFADRQYNPANYSGLGRKYLRKNMINGKNILTQDMINESNTIYIIREDYDLDGQGITIPENCILKFDGGSINNGTINYNDANIINIKLKTQGIFNEKPLSSINVPIGFAYFCTDKQTIEGATPGIIIYHKGNDVWVDALGRVVE